MIKRIHLLFVLATVATPAAVLVGREASDAQTIIDERYSTAEIEACSGDAMRLCADSIPDIPRVRSCIVANRQQLSARCAALVAHHVR